MAMPRISKKGAAGDFAIEVDSNQARRNRPFQFRFGFVIMSFLLEAA